MRRSPGARCGWSGTSFAAREHADERHAECEGDGQENVVAVLAEELAFEVVLEHETDHQHQEEMHLGHRLEHVVLVEPEGHRVDLCREKPEACPHANTDLQDRAGGSASCY